jgi:serine protease
MMISRFIQVTILPILMMATTYAQSTSSYYIKLVDINDTEKTLRELHTHFPQAIINRPFERNTFENLHHVIRMDEGGSSLDEIKKILDVPLEYIEKVPEGKMAYTPNDLGVELGAQNQWYLHRTSAKGAWDFSKGSSDVIIAVIDNSFLSDHPDLVNKIVINNAEIPGDNIDNDNNGFIDDFAGWNAHDNDGNVYGNSSNSTHGTHVAGIAAAETDNGIGISSLSFSSRLLPIKASNAADNITHGYEGINFAAESGAKVINCSWGSFDSSATAKSVVNFALSKNCFVVASAGNFANEIAVYPATYFGVVSVAATTQSDAKLNTSSFNKRVNICAPGAGIWSTIISPAGAPSYGFLSGTSSASPLVASLLGLMSGYAPTGNDATILECMYSTATDIYEIQANQAYDNLLGSGRMDAENAMRCLNETLHLGIGDLHKKATVNVYPNPTADFFYIMSLQDDWMENDILWSLKNLGGQELMRGSKNTGDISSLAAGLYFVTITRKQSNETETVKLIKRNN